MSSRKNIFQIGWITFLVTAALLGLTWFNYQFSAKNPGGNDFLARWNGARFWVVQGISPYDPQVGLAAQEMIYGHPANTAENQDENLFVYPMFSMIFFGPLGFLNYVTARALWMTLLEITLLVLTFISLKISNWKLAPGGLAAVLLFSIFWYPGFRTLILGQFSAINALLILAGIVCVQQKRDVLAGIFFAFSLAKPQMSFLIIPFSLIWGLSNKRWKLIGSTFASLILLLVIPMVFLPDWPIQWVRQLLMYPGYTERIGSIVEILGNSVPRFGEAFTILLYILFGIFLLWAWGRSWGKDERWFLWTALVTLVVTNIVAIRTATPHFVELLPVLFIVFQSWQQRWARKGQLTAWFTLGAVFLGLWVLFLMTVQGNTESPAMYPILPLACFIGLLWCQFDFKKPREKVSPSLSAS